MPSLSLRPLAQVNFDRFTAAFNDAYRDYFIPIHMDPASFRDLMACDNIDLATSVAALEDETVVGTGLLGIRGDMGWIGGLGVVPSHRRRGIARQMMQYLLARGSEQNLVEIKLEVIESNEGAYKLYREIGFVDERYLHIMERSPGKTPTLPTDFQVETRPVESLLPFYEVFHDVPNCWQREFHSLQALASHMQGWATLSGTQVTGYALGWGNSLNIRLVDLTAAPNGDRQLQARTLLAYLHRQYPEAYGSGYNIAANDFTLSAYEALDYHTVFRQIEMKYRLQGP